MNTEIRQVLDLVSQPAFLAKDGKIIWCNHAARGILSEGTPLYALLEGENELFSLWTRDGTLQIPLILNGVEYDASVRATEAGDLFIASRRSHELDATAAAVVSASASLRKPLHTMVSAAGELFEQLDSSKLSESAAQLNQSIYQLVRLCGQMSDGGQLLLRRKEARRLPTDLSDFLSAFVQQARPLVESAGLHFSFTPPPSPLRADVDKGLLERALYNLLSNAMSYTPTGGNITLSVRKQKQLLLFCVTDDGEGISQKVMASLFERFGFSGLGDSRWGIGLGLSMVREIARLHGGTMMVAQNPSGQGTSVTFSVSTEPTTLNLRSSMVYYDYCGGFHHGLVELSDVLDAKMFNPVEIQ